MAPMFLTRQQRLARLREEHPHLEHVPDDWIQEHVRNTGGPPIRLKPPPHPGPSAEHEVDPDAEDAPHVIDLSTGKFTVPTGEEYDIARDSEDRAEQTRNDVRHYATLSNEFLERHQDRRVTATAGPLREAANELTRIERDTAPPDTYPPGHVVGHVPDPSVSGSAASPMGFLPMTDDANAIVGVGSGIHKKAGQPIRGMVVRETDGRHYRYRLPRPVPSAPPPPSSPSSSGLSIGPPPPSAIPPELSSSSIPSLPPPSSSSHASMSSLPPVPPRQFAPAEPPPVPVRRHAPPLSRPPSSASVRSGPPRPPSGPPRRAAQWLPQHPSWEMGQVVEHPEGSGQRWRMSGASSDGRAYLEPVD